MPIYAYKCAACGHELEEIQKFSDEPLKDCETCGAKGTLAKQLAQTAPPILKGTGWYSTDYGGKKPK